MNANITKVETEPKAEADLKTEEDGLFTVKLKNPVEYNGKTYAELNFDFDSLTGEDAMNIEAELTALGKNIAFPALSSEYQIRVAAKACTEPVGADIFGLLHIRDYVKIKNKAQGFLLGAG